MSRSGVPRRRRGGGRGGHGGARDGHGAAVPDLPGRGAGLRPVRHRVRRPAPPDQATRRHQGTTDTETSSLSAFNPGIIKYWEPSSFVTIF